MSDSNIEDHWMGIGGIGKTAFEFKLNSKDVVTWSEFIVRTNETSNAKRVDLRDRHGACSGNQEFFDQQD